MSHNRNGELTMETNFILTLNCTDRPGIVAGVATELAGIGANITESNQHRDAVTNRFFMRLAFTAPEKTSKDAIERAMKPVVDRFDMKTKIVDGARKPRIIIMVSKFDHAMLHLLYQIRVGWLNAEVAAIVSNHDDSEKNAQLEGIPYHCWKVTKDNKEEQEEKLLELARETEADLVILARYMQVCPITSPLGSSERSSTFIIPSCRPSRAPSLITRLSSVG